MRTNSGELSFGKRENDEEGGVKEKYSFSVHSSAKFIAESITEGTEVST